MHLPLFVQRLSGVVSDITPGKLTFDDLCDAFRLYIPDVVRDQEEAEELIEHVRHKHSHIFSVQCTPESNNSAASIVMLLAPVHVAHLPCCAMLSLCNAVLIPCFASI